MQASAKKSVSTSSTHLLLIMRSHQREPRSQARDHEGAVKKQKVKDPSMPSFGSSTAPLRYVSRRFYAANKDHLVPKSGTYPRYFLAGGMHSGVKKDAKKLDLMLVTSLRPTTASAVFTKNKFQAAPVKYCKTVLEQTKGQNISSVVINSGCANAVTGEGGYRDAVSMGETANASLKNKGSSFVMSTGVIGQPLPIKKILNAIPSLADQLGDSHENWLAATGAICTTDTFPKLRSTSLSIDGKEVRIAGMSKGAGMIHPNMATLLALIATDAKISKPALDSILSYATERSFNAISVDGDMSTNDTLAIIANGGSETKEITPESSDFPVLRDAITAFAQDLAQLVVRDGEGATKFVTVHVTDAATFQDAKTVASTIATSALVKCALYGQDANWGRILCATGYSGVDVVPDKTNVSFIPSDGSPELKLLVNGEPENVDEARASEILAMEDLEIKVSLGTGAEEAKYYTCDFSHEYVTINGSYRT